MIRGVLVLGIAALAATTAQAAPADVLPDLVQEAPTEIEIVRAGRRDMLGFRSAVHNAGHGDLVVVASRPSRAFIQMTARQKITMRDGRTRLHAGAGFARYVASRGHSHWHFFPFERYTLTTVGTGRQVVRDAKTGFCLGDRYRSDPRPPGTRATPRFETLCGEGRPGRLAITEGISVGWGDDYAPFLEGQQIDVTKVPVGTYLLVHTVNARGRILESNMANNSAAVRIRLTRGGSGRTRVQVLGPAP